MPHRRPRQGHQVIGALSQRPSKLEPRRPRPHKSWPGCSGAVPSRNEQQITSPWISEKDIQGDQLSGDSLYRGRAAPPDNKSRVTLTGMCMSCWQRPHCRESWDLETCDRFNLYDQRLRYSRVNCTVAFMEQQEKTIVYENLSRQHIGGVNWWDIVCNLENIVAAWISETLKQRR